jgi:hypothetical protein
MKRIVIVVLMLIIAAVTVTPAAAGSICGALPGKVAALDVALTVAGVPHVTKAIMEQPRVTCWENGSPRPCPLQCAGWTIVLQKDTKTMQMTFSTGGWFMRLK